MAIAPSRLRARIIQDKRPSRARRVHKQISYNEDTSDEENYGSSGFEDNAPAVLPRPRKITRPSTKMNTHKTRSKTRLANPNRKSQGRERQRTSVAKKSTAKKPTGQTIRPLFCSTGKKMPWQTLPFHIISSILAFASGPLVDDASRRTPSVKWLVQMTTLCKTFTEPALSVLYYTPPIISRMQLLRLDELLAAEEGHTPFRYRNKIKHLEIHKFSLTGDLTISSASNLCHIIKLCPLLRGVHFTPSPNDPKRIRAVSSSYQIQQSPSPLIDALVLMRPLLETFTWDFDVKETCIAFEAMDEIHKLMPFNRLPSLTISNIPAGMVQQMTKNQPKSTEKALAEAIGRIQTLKHISFNVVDLDGNPLLSPLPDTLESLVIQNCSKVTSTDMRDFLRNHGSNLKELVLNHNISLNLSFLTDLSLVCPKLEVLKMDLMYFNTHFVFQETEPKFTSLMLDGESPTWPPSLRSIELLYLRKWAIPVAELFFSSLNENSETLTDLRYIKIRASLNESGWRNRIAFRDKWVSQLKKVYQRHRPSSGRGMSSHATPKYPLDADSVQMDIDSDGEIPPVNTRRSTRFRADYGSVNIESGGLSSPSRKRRRLPLRESQDASSLENSTLEDDINPGRALRSKRETSESTLEEPMPDEDFVQGKCDVVDIVIDNLRPTEGQLHESDFLDEEISGDEDWNAEEDKIDPYGYSGNAW